MIVRLFLVLVLFASCQSCSANKEKVLDADAAKTEKVAAKETAKEAKLQVPNSLVKRVVPSRPKEYKKGESVKKQIAKIKVQDQRRKAKPLASYLDDKKSNAVIYVKKGCVFCEALLATMGGERFNSNILIITDESHATFNEFLAKQKENKNVKATWLYDFENKIHKELGFSSFPNILMLAGDSKVIEHQMGLKMIDNPASLKDKPFPEALKALSINTVKWLKTF